MPSSTRPTAWSCGRDRRWRDARRGRRRARRAGMSVAVRASAKNAEQGTWAPRVGRGAASPAQGRASGKRVRAFPCHPGAGARDYFAAGFFFSTEAHPSTRLYLRRVLLVGVLLADQHAPVRPHHPECALGFVEIEVFRSGSHTRRRAARHGHLHEVPAIVGRRARPSADHWCQSLPCVRTRITGPFTSPPERDDLALHLCRRGRSGTQGCACPAKGAAGSSVPRPAEEASVFPARRRR